MNEFRSKRLARLDAEFRVPGDKSMSHRAAILGGMAAGTSGIRGFLPSEDCLNTLRAMQALGARVETRAEIAGHGPVEFLVHGRAMRFDPPAGEVDCGNSGTGMRLLAGLLAAQPFASVLTGDDSLSGRPMGRVIAPLEQMGARIESLGAKPGCAPLRVHGARLHGIRYEMQVASAQVKSALLLAGLFADGTTTVVQPATTRDHTERMLRAFGVHVEVEGPSISVAGGQVPRGREFRVPGDISSAAFWLVAAAALPGARVVIHDVGLNPTRTAVLDVLQRMGAEVEVEVETGAEGEPCGRVEVRGRRLHGTSVRPAEVPNLIDEIPVLAVAAALAEGRTEVRHARELRVKETDRIATVVANLRAMGAEVEEFDDGLAVEGGRPLHGTRLESFGDHRIAMAFAVAGLFAEGETVISNTACVNTSYPGFDHHLRAILAGRGEPADFEPRLLRPA